MFSTNRLILVLLIQAKILTAISEKLVLPLCKETKIEDTVRLVSGPSIVFVKLILTLYMSRIETKEYDIYL